MWNAPVRKKPWFHLRQYLPSPAGFFLLFFVLFPATGCPAGELSADSGEIEAFLRSTIEEGYRESDAGKVLAAYLPDAEIVTHIFGKLSLEEYGIELKRDFGRLTLGKARLDLLEVSPLDGDAIVLVNLSVTGRLPGGIKANRHDRSWLLLSKGEGGWKIRRQSYRRDFGVTGKPHDFSR